MTDLYKKIRETVHPITTDEVLALKVELEHYKLVCETYKGQLSAVNEGIEQYRRGVIASRHQRRQARRKMTKIARQRDEARAALKAFGPVKSICLDSSNIYISGAFTSSSPFVELSEENERQAAAYKAAHNRGLRREELRNKIVEIFATILVLSVVLLAGLCVMVGLGFVLVGLFRAVAWAWEGLVRGG